MIFGQVKMIELSIFNVWLSENQKINITSKYSFGETFDVFFREKYTGLSIFKTSTQFEKGAHYWYKIGPTFNIINGVVIEIRNKNDILFKEIINVGENININLENKLHYDKNDTNSWAPFYEVFIKNAYESNLVKLDKNDIVVDLGANIGMFSLFASSKVKKIFSVEPLPETYNNLIQNLRHLKNIKTFNNAIYSKGGKIEFNKNEVSGASSIFNKQQNFEKVNVDAITFSDFITQNNIEKINYLKVDIEGAEFDLFENIDNNFLENNIDKIFMEVHLMDNFKLDDILNKIGKYFKYKIESEAVDRKGIKLYSISCLNKKIKLNE